MESKTCSMCKNEKHIDIFSLKHTEYRECNSKRGIKRYIENKDKLSNQRKIYYENNGDELLRKRKDRYIHFKDLFRNYFDLEN